MERTIHGDFGWRGMNSRVAPERLEPGQASFISNLYTNDEGVLELRPGWRGLLTTAQANPIYGLTAYRVGSVHRLFWSSGNALYALETTESASPSTVTGTVTVASGTGVQTARWGSFIYGIDGTNAMFRWNGTAWPASNAAAVSNMATPGTAPSVVLGSSATLLSNIGTLTNYSQPYSMTTGSYYPYKEMINDPNFDGSSGTTFNAPWAVSAGQPSVVTITSTVSGGFRFAQLDATGGAAVPEYVTSSSTGLTAPTDSSGTGAKLYFLSCYSWALASGNTSQVLSAEVQLYNSSNVLITGTDTPQFSTVLSSTTSSNIQMVFDHRNVTSDPDKVKVRLGAPNATGSQGIGLNRVYLYAPEQKLNLVSSGDSLSVRRGSVLAFNGILYTAGLRIYNTSISNQNWSAKTGVYFDMKVDPEVTGITLKLLLRSGTTWYSGGLLIADPNGGFVSDLTQFTSTVLSYVDGIGLEFVEDVFMEGALNGIVFDRGIQTQTNAYNKVIFTLNGIKDAGELSNGYTYTYRFSEWDGASITPSTYENSDGNESSGSPISVDVTTTASQRQATITIPAKTNTGADQYLVWREGGVYDDGRYRLVGVATVPGSGTTTFTDNVSDAALFDRPIYQIGRDTFPSGLTAIAVHQGRLWAAKGNTVYVSWVLQEGQESGVYTTLVPDPDDPYLGTKGASFTLDTTGNKDDIKALVPMGTVMLAIREYSVSVISGYDASNFAAQPYLQGNNAGMVGGTAATVRGKAWYMSALGVMEFNGDSPVWVSSDVEGSMTARSPNPQLCFYNDRVFVFNDTTVDSAGLGNGFNQQVHVFDYRSNGWVRWTTPGTGTSSAMALGNIRRTSLFSGSRDGQIYVLNLEGGSNAMVYGDKATPAAATSAVSYELKSRGYGQHQNFSPSRLGRGRLTQVDIDAQGGTDVSGLSMTMDVLSAGSTSIATRAFTAQWTRNAYSFRGFIPSAKSIWHQVKLSGSSSVNLFVYGTHSHFAESEVPRMRITTQ